jgi:hypothetical protein
LEVNSQNVHASIWRLFFLEISGALYNIDFLIYVTPFKCF